MSETDELFAIFKKYWKTLVKWMLRIHNIPEITVDDLYERVNSDNPPILIDVRDTADYNGIGYSTYGHIANARSIPMLELETAIEELAEYKEQEIVTMCPGGGLSLAAVEVLNEAGFKDVKSLKGGTDLWHKKGYPTTSS